LGAIVVAVLDIEADVERARDRELIAYRILDTPPEPAFDRLVAMAAELCDAPVALMTLLDGRRQWFKAKVGIDVDQTPRDASFCAHAVENPSDLMIVADATRDERFRDNPLVLGGPRVRFYAGVPLVVASGRALGTLCVIDHVPRELSDRQKASLRALARVVVRFLERRRAAQLN
jgi:GAF domain-containing protein